MHHLMNVLRAMRALFLCLVCTVCLPLAPVATDRINVARGYANALWWSERVRQEKKRWSILGILQRAAARQEKMNVRGQAMFDELQQRKWDTVYAIKVHAVMLWRIWGIGYGFEALGAFLHSQYPAVYPWWQACLTAGERALHGFWSMFPPY